MNERWQSRKPAAFRLDDPSIVTAPVHERREAVVITHDLELDNLPVPVPPAPRPRRFRWGTLFWSAAGALVSLAFGLAVNRLIEDLFARSEMLGYLGLVLAALAAFALLVVVLRETWSLFRLTRIEKLHARAAEVLVSDDRKGGEAVAHNLLALTKSMPNLAKARASLEGHLGEIIDGADLVRLTERELLASLDQEARRIVSGAAKRVSLVTAVSPRAAIDLAFVFITALGMIRKLAMLYGGRPGTLGLFRLVREAIGHLVMTGGMAAGDSLIQQVFGHSVAAKLSARLGEGVLNGLLTARLGLAAIEVTRPLPFAALPRPGVKDLAADFLPKRESGHAERKN
jgi:putative membrane protein